MSTPKPIYPLSGHCSIIYQNTLYVYSPAGFQSLKLEEGAKWQTLPMDISLTGAQCVKAVPQGNTQDAKLFIVGGRVNATASTWNYPGLMHYTFSKKKWDWQRSESWNTQNRVNHGVAYLQDSQKILIYAGSQVEGDNGPSSEGFLFSTVAPYSVSSLPPAGAPPSVNPMLMESDAKTVMMVGGGATNKAVWKFTESLGWQNLGVDLEQPIANQGTTKCTVISRTDGSVALQKFDMGAKPNTVQRILLLGKGGSPANPGTKVGGKSKRVTLNDWSPYNETYAPTTTRSGYSLAQGTDGTTVATGGDPAAPIVLFNAQENSWMNASAVFNGQQVLANSISSSSSATPTPTLSATSLSVMSSASPTSTEAAASPAEPPSNKGRMLTVLGATLGTIFGIAAILILILLCLRYRKNKNKKANYMEKNNDRMSFADRGAAFMKEAGGSVVAYQSKNESTTSLAIIQGRGGGHKKNIASDASTAGLVKKTSPLGYSEQYSEPYELAKFDLKPEPAETMVRQNSSRQPKPAPRARSSGWSRYFANNEATNLASAPPADRSTFASDRTSTGSQSQYTNSRMFSSRPSQQIAPLQIPKFNDEHRLSSVASGSPTLGTPTTVMPHQIQPMQAELARANSTASSVSALSHDAPHYARNPVDSWTPVGDNRRTSSQYTSSVIMDHGKFDGTSSYYPDGTESFYPKSNFSSFYPGQGTTPVIPDTRDSTVTMFPSGSAPPASTGAMPKSQFSSMYPAPPQLGLSHERESVATLFPGGTVPAPGAQHDAALPSPKFNSFYPPPRDGHESTVTMFPGPASGQNDAKKEQSDMSWLNLGQSR